MSSEARMAHGMAAARIEATRIIVSPGDAQSRLSFALKDEKVAASRIADVVI